MSERDKLREAAERWKAQSYSGNARFDSDQHALADFAARVLAGMPELGELPEGPWRYMPDKFDDWGQVRSPDGMLVADTCPGMNGEEFSRANPGWGDVRRAGPPEARAIAALLIWARGVVGEGE